ncbi:MAG: hypothetical protein XE11_1462 [Methanomicrobiales archaeon 53_19]|nr:MAG: hypothetical protein XD88_0379 [Methanocalculus sp. 52_23]KUL03049.1 MAG: hypothetical protein XE11_1462 [Methanomicrobiales archaeon 53_19]
MQGCGVRKRDCCPKSGAMAGVDEITACGQDLFNGRTEEMEPTGQLPPACAGGLPIRDDIGHAFLPGNRARLHDGAADSRVGTPGDDRRPAIGQAPIGRPWGSLPPSACRRPPEIPKCHLPGANSTSTSTPLLSAGCGPENTDPCDAEPLPEQREHFFELRDELALLLPAHLDCHGYSPPDRTWGEKMMNVVVRGSGLQGERIPDSMLLLQSSP